MFKRGFRLQVLVYSILFFLLTVTCTLSTVYAAEEFATSYNVLYDIDQSGITTVTEKINLTNLTSEYYANQFKLIIGATQISDIKASDGGGIMQVTPEQKNTSTIISVKFNQQVAGINKVLPWTLQFKSKDFAQNLGKVWEIRAPKVSSENLLDYNLTISVPVEFGEPTAISPTPKTQSKSGGKIFLTFNKDQLEQSGVSASFGTNQLFDFNLTYHLENNNLVPILTNIALPPDTAYQDVIYQRFEPKPLNVTVDDDGNYLAWYKLNRNEKLDVKLIGSSKLYTISKVKRPNLDNNLRKKYTQPAKYWEKDHPQIQAKLKEILADAKEEDKVKLIYQYVVNTLKYDSGRLKDNIERLGAVTALNNPDSAVCMEFTDLFIAFARAANIPARELDGYAYTTNTTLRPLSFTKDILHSWPQYWDDKKGWVMVDPTWENTSGGVDYFNKFDLNHFVFVTRGSSSESPIPAGSYKFENQDTRDVKVNLSENDFLGTPLLDVKIDSPNPFLAGFPGKIKVKISNVGNAFYPSDDLIVKSNKLIVLGGESQILGPIPAFGESTFDFNIRTKTLFDRFNDTITVLIGSQKFSKDIKVQPFIIFQTFPFITIGIVALMGIIYFIILGTHIYKAKASVKAKR
ncbi:hypothetical protein HYW41_02710 [Candidatus Daviesbacteria bacterium]|nr:hypothetical protein [Candidatus Daviesbacteria bacterium]